MGQTKGGSGVPYLGLHGSAGIAGLGRTLSLETAAAGAGLLVLATCYAFHGDCSLRGGVSCSFGHGGGFPLGRWGAGAGISTEQPAHPAYPWPWNAVTDRVELVLAPQAINPRDLTLAGHNTRLHKRIEGSRRRENKWRDYNYDNLSYAKHFALLSALVC